MLKLYVFKKDVGLYKTGDTVEFDPVTVKSMLDSGLIEESVGVEDGIVTKALGHLTKSMTDVVDRAAQAALERIATTAPTRVDPGESQADKTKSLGDFFHCVMHASSPNSELRTKSADRIDKVYKVKRHEEGIGSSAGFLLPPSYSSEIFSVADEGSVFEQYCRSVSMPSPKHIEPALAQTKTPGAKASAYHAGVKMWHKSEKAARQPSDLQFEQIEMNAVDLTGLTEVTRDAFADVPSLDGKIREVFGKALSWRREFEFLLGNGVGAPLGALHEANPSRLLVNRTTANTVKYADILAMTAKMIASGMAGSYWLASQTIIPQLGVLQDPGGNSVFVAATSGGARDALPMTLMGRPVRYTEKCPPLGSPGDLCLVCPSFYFKGEYKTLEVGMSEHWKFDEDVIAFRFKYRYDGQPAIKGKIKLSDGGKTSGNTEVSPFIVLN